MHPTDHMSTENKNEMKINKKTGIEQQINENTWLPMRQSSGLNFCWLDKSPVLQHFKTVGRREHKNVRALSAMQLN